MLKRLLYLYLIIMISRGNRVHLENGERANFDIHIIMQGERVFKRAWERKGHRKQWMREKVDREKREREGGEKEEGRRERKRVGKKDSLSNTPGSLGSLS